MDHAFDLRNATPDEIQGLFNLWRRAGIAHSVTDTIPSLKRLIEGWPECLIVAMDGSRVIGSIIWDFGGWRAHFYRLAVDPDYRRHGLGQRLVDEAERRIQALGARRVNLLVESDRPLAVAFWENSAYEQRPNARLYVRELSELE